MSASAAQAAPWVCDAAGYVTQWDAIGTGGDTLFQKVERQPDGTYRLNTLGRYPGDQLNAIGFRAQDGNIYALNNDTLEVIRIGDNGSGRPTFTSLGRPAGFPWATGAVVGTMLADGTYFIWQTVSNSGVRLDVSGARATVIDTVAADASLATIAFSDFAVNAADNKLYASVIDRARSNSEIGVYELVLSGRTLALGARAGDGVHSGAQWFTPAGANGTLIQWKNGNGDGLFATDIATGTMTAVGGAPQASNVDGASCPYTIAVTKDASPRTVTAGAELTYTHTITSRALGDYPVAFADVLPAGMTYVPGGVTVTPAFGTPNAYGGTDTLTVVGDVARNQTVTITARVRVSPDHACDVAVENQSQATLRAPGLPEVTVDSDDPTTPENPEDSTRAQVDCAADVSVRKAALSSPAFPGQELTYRLTAHNAGPSSARDVVITDPLPAQTSFVSASPGCTEAAGTVTCAAGTLQPGAQAAYDVTVRLSDGATGEVVNTATATSRTPDPDTSNNRDTRREPVEPLADLSIVKQATSNRLVPGRTLRYRLTVRNAGPSRAVNVRVSDSLPRGLTFVSASDGCELRSGAVTCALASLDAGASRTFTVTTRVASSVTGRVVNTATVGSDTRDPDESNNRSTERVPSGPEADLSIVKTASADRVQVGQQLFYTLVVRNDGPSDAAGVVVTDSAPAGLTLLAATASQGRCSIADGTATCTLGTLASGGSAQVLVSARADAAGELENTATVDARTPDPDPYDNRDRRRVPVDPTPPGPVPLPADLEVVKRANRRVLVGNKAVRYTVTVTNNGPGAANAVQVLDTPSLPVRVRAAKASQGSCGRTVPIACDLGRLAAGEQATVRVVLVPLAPGRLRNSASVTGDVPDPDGSNNIDSADTKVRGLLRVKKTASRKQVMAGGIVRYRITVANASPFALRAVRVCDRLPAGMAYVGAKPKGRLTRGKRCWTIARLGAHKRKTLRVTARALRGAAGTKVNRVAARARGAKPGRARRAVRVVAGGVKAGGVTG